MPDKIKDDIRNYIINKSKIQSNDTDFNDDLNLYKYGYLDSMDSMSVVFFIEENFNIKITKEDILMHNLQTINNIGEKQPYVAILAQ